VGGLRADLDNAMAKVLKENDGARKKSLAREAIRLRLQMARAWEQMMSHLVSATDTPGELGTIANQEQHTRKRLGFLSYYDGLLAEILGESLPMEAEPGKTYTGPARLIVPTVRSQVSGGEKLTLRIMAVDREPVRNVQLHWRPMGSQTFSTIPAKSEGRSVFSAVLASGKEDVEYYLTALTAKGAKLVWPAAAPRLCQTVIVLP
jgi:hypothetical protein